ncbi:regulatory protein, Fis family [Pseudomonas syringae]|uniref:Type III transcriptional regulator HrpS n=7 Tax=Pseudomonas syringae group TaxID=136849 RepID=A0A3M3RGM7_9PSED|nr:MULTISPECIES: transcriptional regulator HrpS [Pseudomonas syringae group]KTC05308.1 AAA family ATPase [Pseudomonas syringae ICMP 11292]POD71580.1 AAA family ATPase [Pseudomonas syringae group genomosp. 3]RMN42778.1 Type III transcriptional regulator HrpS [Pseudomonas syringae pv. apii]RMN47697.1 Type III transcriptional regulator HrpS [Pseudomonas syringae pv. apii]RMN95539.1 Type III transcriptional regulator HrpS [Pseudomonas syringae pv. apii]
MSLDERFEDDLDEERVPNLGIVAESISQLGIDVLLSGETGTGKDTIARRIHEMSGRKGRLVAMNCAAIPESLAESELFGVVSGAYTGADRSRVGYVEAAQGGTLYLDEIDSMPLSLQAKLLRVLETRALERLGSTSTIKLDICVIASAQCSLDDAVERGQFRRDLYFRLNVLTLKLPPLRNQSDRIVPLFTRFTAAAARELGVPVPDVCPLLHKVLLGHDWPGNIRELKAAAKRHVLGFPLLGAEPQGEEHLACGLKSQLRVIEKALIQESLKRHDNCVDSVSLELDMPRRTLYRRIKELQI